MLQPGLKVPGTGFDNRTRLEAVRGQTVNRFLRKVIENGQIVLPGSADVDVRSACVLALQKLGFGQDRLFYETCVTGEHAPFAQNANVVGGCGERIEHSVNRDNCSVHRPSIPRELRML